MKVTSKEVCECILFLLLLLRYRGLNAGAFYLHATPPALFFILYFETGSHEVAEGLTRERERERERTEAGREPGSSGLRLPKYWDYKRAPPLPAEIFFSKRAGRETQKMGMVAHAYNPSTW